MTAVVVLQCSAILGKLGKKLSTASIDMEASKTKVNILGWVLRLKKTRLRKFFSLQRAKPFIKSCPYYAKAHGHLPPHAWAWGSFYTYKRLIQSSHVPRAQQLRFLQICVNVTLIFVISLCQYIEKNGTKYVKPENTRRINFSQIKVWPLSNVMQVPWPTLWQLYYRPRLTETQREK